MNTKEIHEKLREVLISYNCEEYGDCIIDEICDLLSFPNTNNFEDEIYYFEDWVNNMLNDSDYTEFELMEFEEYYQNLLTFEENTEIFIEQSK